nr:polymerase [Soil-borne virus 2]
MDSVVSKLQSSELIDAVLHTSATRTQSELHQTMCQLYQNQIKDSLKKNENKKKIDIKRNLTEEQLQTLGDLFPERRIVSTCVSRGTHSMAAAMRKIETDIILSAFPKKCTIFDVGGNWATHAKRCDDRMVHCCCPILDFRDAQRKTTRMLSYNKFIEDAKELKPAVARRAEEIAEDNSRIVGNILKGERYSEAMDGKWFCQNKFEDCVFGENSKDTSLKVGMAVHSIYDIHLIDLVGAMQRKGIKVLTGTFLFSVDLLLGKKEGNLPTVNGFFRVEGKKVKYGFHDDPNCGYEHELSSLLMYVTKTFVKSPGGNVYYLELNEMRGDVMFFTLTDATEAQSMGVKSDSSFKCIPLNDRGKVVFPVFDVEAKTGEIVFREECLNRDFVSRALEYVSRLKDNQLNSETIISYLASTNNAVVIGGSARKTTEKVDPKLLPMVATTLIVYSEVQRKKQKMVISKLRSRVQEELQFKQIVECIFHRVFGKDSTYQKVLQVFAGWVNFANGGKIVDLCDTPIFVEVKDRIKLWSENATADSVLLSFNDIDAKVRLYEECEAERQRISEMLVQEKTGLYDSENIQIGVTKAEGKNQETSPSDAFRRWMETEDAFSFNSDNMSVNETSTTKSSNSVSKKFMREWIEGDDHFNSAKSIPRSRRVFNFQGFMDTLKGLLKIVEPEPFEYLDDDEVWESLETRLLRSEKEEVSMETVLERVPEVCISETILLDAVKEEKTAESISAPAQIMKVEEVKLDIVPEKFSACAEIDDYVSDADSWKEDVCDSGDSVSVGYECDEETIFNDSSSLSGLSTRVTVEKPSLKGKEKVICHEESTWEMGETSRWAQMAEDSDLAQGFKELPPCEDQFAVRYAKLPEYPAEEDGDDFRTLAKKEAHFYLKAKLVADKSSMVDIVRDFLYGNFHNGKCKTPKDACFLDCSVYKQGKWVLDKKPKRMGHAFAVGVKNRDWKTCRLVPMSWETEDRKVIGDKPIVSEGAFDLYMLCDLTFLMNDMIILKNIEDVMRKRERKVAPRVTLIDGVPGCGKSTHIVENADLSKHYVLTMGKEAALDLKERFRKKNFTESQLSRVRTVDSFLMHDLNSRANVLQFDEALMAHAGIVYFCADILSARVVVCQGDSQQIPFVQRVEGINLKYSKLQLDSVVEKRHTYRSPVDVAMFLTKKNFYGTSIVTTSNETLRSLKTVGPRDGMTSMYTVPKIKFATYLTFTQAEKEEVSQYLGVGKWTVNTVHEAQGKTYDDVILVRLKPTDNEIYPGGGKSKPYVVVGTTRHRRSLVYYTMAEDSLYFDISNMLEVQENKLFKHLYIENSL